MFRVKTLTNTLRSVLFLTLVSSVIPKCLSVEVQPVNFGMALIGKKNIEHIRGEEHFPLSSVMKLFQGVAVLDSMSRAGLSLDTEITVTPDNLKTDTWSPMRDAHPEGGTLPLSRILEYSLQESDNNACDILFSRFYSPERLTAWLRNKEFEDIVIRYTEDDMHRDPARAFENTATPFATAEFLESLYNGELLDETMTAWMIKTLEDCNTGADRIPAAPYPAGTRIGHKTGTGFETAGKQTGINDAAVVTLPDGKRYILVVFVRESALDSAGTDGFISAIAQSTLQKEL